LSDGGSTAGKSEDEENPVDDDEQESEQSSTDGDTGSEPEEECVSGEERPHAEEDENKPISCPQDEGEPVFKEEHPKDGAIPDQGPMPGKPSPQQQPPCEEERSDKPLPDRSASDQTATLEALTELTLEEPTSPLPRPRHSARPNPPFDVVINRSSAFSTGSARNPEQTEKLPATPRADTTPASSRPNDIFKKRVYLKHPTRPGMKICVKLPDVRGTDLFTPSPSNSRPPLMLAPKFSTTQLGHRYVGPFTAQHHRQRYSVKQHVAQTAPGYIPFYASTDAQHDVGGEGQTSAHSWPSGIQFDFKVPQSGDLPTPEWTPSHLEKLKGIDLNSDANNVFVGGLNVPAMGKMRLPGFASAMPFTPPASTDNTPQKQAPGNTPGRPMGLSDGRDKTFSQTLQALLPTPGPSPDEDTGRERGAKRPVLETHRDKRAGADSDKQG
jgi:hypothetical protein